MKLKRRWKNAEQLKPEILKVDPDYPTDISPEAMMTDQGSDDKKVVMIQDYEDPQQIIEVTDSDQEVKTFTQLLTSTSPIMSPAIVETPRRKAISKLLRVGGSSSQDVKTKTTSAPVSSTVNKIAETLLQKKIYLTEQKIEYYTKKMKEKRERHELKISILERALNRQ